MRIEGPSKPRGPTGPRKSEKKSSTSKSGFSQALGGGAGEAEASSPAHQTAPIAAVDALIALQEAGSEQSGAHRHAFERGHRMLDLLEEIRRGILLGSIPRSKLESLARLARERRSRFVEPGLAAVLEEIELRAEVELAKLEREAADHGDEASR